MTTFDDAYETIYSYSFEATDTPSRSYCRPDAERRCWSCSKRKGETKFSSEAHVIPALLGNRSLFSLEECDGCNNTHGRTLEQALADYLTLWRAMSRIRSRKGSFKHRTVPDRSYIEGKPSENRLVLELYDNEDSVEVQDESGGDLLLRTSVPPSNPVSACKALARMAYFCMPDEDRARSAHIKSWILGEVEYLPVFLEVFLPGTGQRLVTLRIFRAREGHSGIAPYLVEFDYGSVVLFLPLPDQGLQRPSGVAMPAVPHSPYPPHIPRVTRITCIKNDRIPRHMEEVRIHYGAKLDLGTLGVGVELGDVIARSAALSTAKTSQPDAPVELKELNYPIKILLIDREGRILADAGVSIRSVRLDANGFELTAADERTGWSLRFIVRDGDSGNLDVEWADPCQLPLDAARDQLELRSRARSASTIELRTRGSSAPLVWAHVDSAAAGWDPSPAMIKVAQRLAIVAAKIGEDLRLPRELNEEVAREVEWASSAVEFGEFCVPQAPYYDVRLNEQSIEYLEKEFKDGAAPPGLMAPVGSHLPLLGKELPTGVIHILLEEPRLVDGLQETIERLRGVMPPRYVNVQFTAQRAIFRFERFMQPPA